MENTDYLILWDKFLSDELTKDETRLLVQWMKENPHFKQWMEEQWSLASPDMDEKLQDKLFEQLQSHIQSENITSLPVAGKRHTFYLWTARIAAVIALLFVTGVSVYYYTEASGVMPDTVIFVEKGQKASLILPDGSKVWLNSDSHLTYGSRFNQKERTLMLEGEAFFEVTPDSKRPFIVETATLSVKALGTSFNVKSYEQERNVTTVLETGKVEVSKGTNSYILLPNEMLILDKVSDEMEKKKVDLATDYSNWKYNKISFNAETFENIVFMLERDYNTTIVFESESLKQYKFTGTLGNTSLESILQILSLTSPLVYEVQKDKIILKENIAEKAWYEKATQ